jgi:hypothetical protein
MGRSTGKDEGMTARFIPGNVHRQPKNDRTMSEAIATAQGTSVARREVPVTLAKAPWEKDQSDE